MIFLSYMRCKETVIWVEEKLSERDTAASEKVYPKLSMLSRVLHHRMVLSLTAYKFMNLGIPEPGSTVRLREEV